MVNMEAFASAFGFDAKSDDVWTTLGKVNAVNQDGTLSVKLGGSATPTTCEAYCTARAGDIVFVVISKGRARAVACKGGDGNGKYLPLAGGTLTGALSGTSATFSGNVVAGNTLTLGTNTSAEENGIKIKGGGSRNQYAMRVISASNGDGDAVLLGDGGLTIIGAGESAPNLYSELGLSAGTERLYLASDNAVYLVPNCQTVANRTEYSVAAKGIETPTYSGVQYIQGAKGNAALYVKKSTGSNYYPAVCLTTAGGGAWCMGNYNNEYLQFSWCSAENISSSTNTASTVNLRNTAGTIALLPTQLYNSASGSASTVALSETAANFNHMRIYYSTNTAANATSYTAGGVSSVDVYSPNGKYVELVGAHRISDTQVQFRSAIAYISGTTITINSTSQGMYANISNGSSPAVGKEAKTYIYRVEAWNE